MNTFRVAMGGTEFLANLNRYKRYDIREAGCYVDDSHDDTVNFQATIAEAAANGGGDIIVPDTGHDCIINGALDANGFQLSIPTKLLSEQTRMTIRIMGERPGNFLQGAGIGAGPVAPNTGSRIRSTLISSTPYSAIIGTKATSGYLYNNYNTIIVEDLQIRYTPDSGKATIGGLGFARGSNCIIRNVAVAPFNVSLLDSAEPTNACIGIDMPAINCEQANIVDSCWVGGLTSGFKTGDHTSLNNIIAWCNGNGIEVGPSAMAIFIGKFYSMYNKRPLSFTGGNSRINCASINCEGPDQTKWFDYENAVDDPSNYGHGIIVYDTGLSTNAWSKSGGTHLRCMPTAPTSFIVGGHRSSPEEALKDLLAMGEALGLWQDDTTT